MTKRIQDHRGWPSAGQRRPVSFWAEPAGSPALGSEVNAGAGPREPPGLPSCLAVGPHQTQGSGSGWRGAGGPVEGGQRGRRTPPKATGCRWPGSWARWGTQAGCSPRSCCTGPPGTADSARRLCSTPSVPSGSSRQPRGRCCAPAGVEERTVERPTWVRGGAFLKQMTNCRSFRKSAEAETGSGGGALKATPAL